MHFSPGGSGLMLLIPRPRSLSTMKRYRYWLGLFEDYTPPGSVDALDARDHGSRRKGAPEVEKVSLTTTKLGGQLEPFSDVAKGYRCAKPLGWNRYDGTSSEYVVKLVDLVDPTQVILLTNSPVKSETQVRP